MPRRSQKPRKTVLDSQKPVCYNVSNAGEIVAASQVDRGPDQNLIPAANGFHGSPKSESKHLQTDSVKCEPYKLHWLWNETRRQLQRYATRADEGVEIQAAMDFARWIEFSGLIKLFKYNPQPEPWKVDWLLIDSLVRNLVMDCGDYLKLNTPGFVRVSQLEAVNTKLDILAAQVARLSPPAMETATARTVPPALQVIQGGVK